MDIVASGRGLLKLNPLIPLIAHHNSSRLPDDGTGDGDGWRWRRVRAVHLEQRVQHFDRLRLLRLVCAYGY